MWRSAVGTRGYLLRGAVLPLRRFPSSTAQLSRSRFLSTEPTETSKELVDKAKAIWNKTDGRTYLYITVGAAFGLGVLLRKQFSSKAEPEHHPEPPLQAPSGEEHAEENADVDTNESVTLTEADISSVSETAQEVDNGEDSDVAPPPVVETVNTEEEKGDTTEVNISELETSSTTTSLEAPLEADLPIAAEGEEETSRSTPKHLRYDYVLVGAGTASYAALKEILDRDPEASVLIIGDEKVEPYMRPPLTKDVWEQEASNNTASSYMYVHGGKRLSLRYHTNRWYDKLSNVDTMFGMTVKSLNPNAKMLVLDNRQMTVVNFGKCLLATGASQVVPPGVDVSEDAQRYLTFFHTVEDFGRVENVVNRGGKIVVVGDGLVASELSCSVVKRGVVSGAEVTQITQEAGLLRASLPPYLSDYATRKVAETGVQMVTGTAVVAVEAMEDNRASVVLENGERVEADLVVMAAAEAPNVSYGAGYLEVDQSCGGFVVNQELQARSGIYAAGDVASYYDSALGRRRLSHYDHAYESGIVAGRNMTGEEQAYAYQPMHWGQLGDLEFYSVGNCDAEPSRTVAFWAKPPEKHRLEMVSQPGQDYRRGVIYYLRPDNVVVGVLLWGMRPKSSDLESMRRLIYKNKQPFYHMDQLKDRITLQDWSDEEYELALGPPVDADQAVNAADAEE